MNDKTKNLKPGDVLVLKKDGIRIVVKDVQTNGNIRYSVFDEQGRRRFSWDSYNEDQDLKINKAHFLDIHTLFNRIGV